MKSRIATLIILFVITGTHLLHAQKSEQRKLSAFTEISLKIGANVHLSQGSN